MHPDSINNIFSTDTADFDDRCLEMFSFQYHNNSIYRQWCDAIGRNTGNVDRIETIPFLPISFFKTHQVVTTEFEADVVFQSSGTTATTLSRHYVKDERIYKQSFLQSFRQFYGDPSKYCIVALLPSYLERGGSSLVYMVDEVIKQSKHPGSGFYLHEHTALANKLLELEGSQQQTILFGVTYALLDFAESFPMQLDHTTIIETGGMKGRKKEMTRWEVHEILKRQFKGKAIHSEYSMTELLSQAYSAGEGRFFTPYWMKILVRGEDDPFDVKQQGRGVINIIDLANVYSCCFIATDDAGILNNDGSFEVLGRVDNSDVRGCSLLVLE